MDFCCQIMGRPKADKGKLRNINFTIRLTANEIKELDGAASLCGKATGELIRHKLFSGKFPEAKTARLELNTYLELKKIGVNLNQLTKLAHSGRIDMNLINILMRLMQQQETIIAQILYRDSQPGHR